MQGRQLCEIDRCQHNGGHKGWGRTADESVNLCHLIQSVHKGWNRLHKGIHSSVDGLSNPRCIYQRFRGCRQRVNNRLLTWRGRQSILDISFLIKVSIGRKIQTTLPIVWIWKYDRPTDFI
jgi:hypothetical protein